MIDTKALAARDAAPVLIVSTMESVKTANAVLPAYVTMAYEAGDKAALDPLKGRKVDVWPDASDEAKAVAAGLCNLLLTLPATVRVVNPNGQPPGWNIAVAVEGGMDRAAVVAFAREHLTEVKMPVPAPASKLKFEPVSNLPAKSHTDPVEITHETGASSVVQVIKRWGLTVTDRRRPHPSLDNVLTCLEMEAQEGNAFDIWHDVFADCLMWAPPGKNNRLWTPVDTNKLTRYLQQKAGMPNLQIRTVEAAVVTYASDRPRNEVVEFLDTAQELGWDGTPRLSELIHRGFGGELNEYTAAVGQCFLMGLVARALNPGCQLDNLPVLEGRQGAKKTGVLRALGGRWFSEIRESMVSKEFLINLQGSWLIEISEMDSLQKAENSRVKGVITDRDDKYRDVYGKTAYKHPRRSAFACTTNKSDWNNDETGARRYWPVMCGECDISWVEDNRWQLFAEARFRYESGQPYWEVPIDEARKLQESRYQKDPWEEAIVFFLGLLPEKKVLTSYLLGELKVDMKDRHTGHTRRVTSVLKRLGWEARQEWVGRHNLNMWYGPKDEEGAP